MKNKRALIISMVVFFLVGIVALFLVINKGHIGNYSLVSTKSGEENILPTLSLELEKEFLSSEDDEEVSKVTVMIDGEIVTQGVELESSDEQIAKINENNEIVPVSDGKATITAKYDGVEATSEIEVVTPIKTMSFTSTSSTIRVNKDLQLKLKATPSDAFVDELEYTSSDESIATVNANGIVTGIAPGKVTITVYDPITEMKKTVNLTIKK